MQHLADGLNFTDNPCLLQKASHFFFSGYGLYSCNPAHPLWDIIVFFVFLFNKKKNFTPEWLDRNSKLERKRANPLIV